MTRRLLCLLLLLVISPAAVAQSVEPLRFLIDSIRVEGLRWGSERVVIAQSRLHAGREYLESEIRAGAARAARLPFVVRIDPRLERGEQRGSYELVLDVIEAKPMFLGALGIFGDEGESYRNATIGGRLFVGRSGLLHAAATGGDGRQLELGYTQYDLFGTGASVTAVIQRRKLETPPSSLIEVDGSDHIRTQLIAAVPIRGNHAVRGTFIREPIVIRGFFSDDRPFRVEHVTTSELAWIYDSTDDRIFPTTGTAVVANASLRRGPYVAVDLNRTERLTHYTRPSFGVSGRHHHQLLPDHSIWVGGNYRHSRRGAVVFNQIGQREMRTSRFTDASAHTGYAFTPWSGERSRRLGDLRFEAYVLGLAQRGTIPRDPFIGDQRVSENIFVASVGVVYRNPWTVVRFYLEAVGGDP
ncbi:MAG TPA: hypothetical protein VF057_08125 [Thermoanaerobaculia bacterium]